ncbi:hypothetical protein K439DRAFT_696496 [Ramaria rubella]|nr:hypothetical protein K439DRAFT_696496 [Ramaria rubella]
MESSPISHGLPVELVRKILELAARHGPTAVTLCCVSKTVKSWIISTIYRTLIIGDPSHPSGIHATLDSHLNEGHYEYHAAIHNICITFLGSPSVLQHCVNLRHLAIDALSTIHVEVRKRRIPSLTHLTLYHMAESSLLCGPLFHSITHLFVNYRFFVFSHDFEDVHLPNLTHFVGSIMIDETPSLERDFFSRIQRLSMKLRVIGICPLRFDGRNFQPDTKTPSAWLLQSLGLFDQPGAVLLRLSVDGVDMHTWKQWCDGEENVWECAERLVLERTQTLAWTQNATNQLKL